ncbi:MAG TPA: hypothetical protein VFF73_41310 [Planctomycetota bacterium]|nr:hypothetical protein [Planctomycetota bacterium]
MRLVLALTLAFLAGCIAIDPLPPEQTFHFDLTPRGIGGERTLLLDAFPDFMGPLGYEVPMDDVTSTDDAIKAIRRIEVHFPIHNVARPAAPTSGHIEWKELAARSPVQLVLQFKGHSDAYRLIFPVNGGLVVEPERGEWSRIRVRP